MFQSTTKSSSRALDRKVSRLAFTQNKQIIHPSQPRDSSDNTRNKRLGAITKYIKKKDEPVSEPVSEPVIEDLVIDFSGTTSLESWETYALSHSVIVDYLPSSQLLWKNFPSNHPSLTGISSTAHPTSNDVVSVQFIINSKDYNHIDIFYQNGTHGPNGTGVFGIFMSKLALMFYKADSTPNFGTIAQYNSDGDWTALAEMNKGIGTHSQSIISNTEYIALFRIKHRGGVNRILANTLKITLSKI